MKYRYDAEAEKFMKQLPLFSIEKFETWVDSLVLQIGQQNILQYLEEKLRWNAKCKIRGQVLRCDFSQQAKSVIKYLPNFNAEECKIWFSNSLVLSKGDILNYLEQEK